MRDVSVCDITRYITEFLSRHGLIPPDLNHRRHDYEDVAKSDSCHRIHEPVRFADFRSLCSAAEVRAKRA